jgi:hypothetical protein
MVSVGLGSWHVVSARLRDSAGIHDCDLSLVIIEDKGQTKYKFICKQYALFYIPHFYTSV